MQRIKASEVKSYREQYLQDQQHLCALCKEHIEPIEAVLDHCHITGKLRAVLHRGCNAYLGTIENNRKRNRITESRLKNILANAVDYMTAYKELLHPTYRTDEEKKTRAKVRTRLKKAGSKSVTNESKTPKN